MKEVEITDNHWKPTGRKAIIDEPGITVNGTLIKWNDLCDAVQAASECHREGTKANSDLIQSAFDYIPFIYKYKQWEREPE